jgi:hypothetical protein
VTWEKKAASPHTGTFVAGETYTATVTLAPAPGHAFDAGAAFTHSQGDGDPAVTVAGDNRTVVIKFVKTPPAEMITEVFLNNYISKPVVGQQKPAPHFDAPGYRGDISWTDSNNKDNDNSGPFLSGSKYMATITLYPLLGFAFDEGLNSLMVHAPDYSSNCDISMESANLPDWLVIKLSWKTAL